MFNYMNKNFYNNLLNKNIKDFGNNPLVTNIRNVTNLNNNYRKVLFTGDYLQVTLMCLNVGENIGLECHENLDQFLKIESGIGCVRIGSSKDNIEFEMNVCDNFAIIIPAGKYHDLINVGCMPLKLYSIYAPIEHEKNLVEINKPSDLHN